MSVETITLGCRLNFAESEAMKARAPDGTVIVNSCAVTGEAVRQTRQAIRRARRERPEARIVVTGCAAQLEPESFAVMPEVDLVVGNGGKLASSSLVLNGGRQAEVEGRSAGDTPFDLALRAPLRTSEKIASRSLQFTSSPVAAGFRQRVRSFVAVQTGCDHRCTFCTIWQARGPSVTLPYSAVRDAVARELAAGAKEIVLTGVDITSVEGGLGPLCERLVVDLPALKRLRLSSLDSIEVDEALMALIAGEPRLMPHFHLSLQAGDDLILKRMKRRHSRADAVRLVERIKTLRPDATIGADLIAGFPTETEEAAINTLRLLDDCGIVAAHVFPFSPRPNTPAARMPQVEREIVKARAARLRAAAAERRSAWFDSLVGSAQPVLIENSEKGHTDSFAPVFVAGSSRGQTGLARIIGRTGDHLIGTFVQ
ncbi:MiaB/RimO family radical SAM methylthiotransferase [Sphingomonas arenae]|uniref:MiaB/RimO family radical SAM methylthiotransferase n=1 Tax=Sphingomonas arenae TaxID=2812555 RepID=UPI0019688163|nr:MiaB/RimO family radical SAM methylthiotransferase [Sphingomonas arenae]